MTKVSFIDLVEGVKLTPMQFVRRFREEIDAIIKRNYMGRGWRADIQGNMTDEDRVEWLSSDEDLYKWAVSRGVDFDDEEDVN